MPAADSITSWTTLTLTSHTGTEQTTDLDVFCECVEDLFGHFNGFGEVVLTVHINRSFPRVVPEEVADRLLEEAQIYVAALRMDPVNS